MTLIEKESGADQVDAILMDAVQGNALLHGCFASLTEVESRQPGRTFFFSGSLGLPHRIE